MAFLEIRRHSVYVPPNPHLSPFGRHLAQRVGQTTRPFGFIYTSPLPRTIETAHAMGYKVDRSFELLGNLGWDVETELQNAASYRSIALSLRENGPTAQYAEQLVNLWRTILKGLPENEQTLIITHQKIIEVGAVACLPENDFSSWGKLSGYCEGVKLEYANGHFFQANILRVDPYDKE